MRGQHQSLDQPFGQGGRLGRGNKMTHIATFAQCAPESFDFGVAVAEFFGVHECSRLVQEQLGDGFRIRRKVKMHIAGCQTVTAVNCLADSSIRAN